MKPEFPDVHCVLLGPRGPGHEDRLKRTPYESLADLANALEMIDTREWSEIWIEDRTGDKWDVKLDVLNGKVEDAEFFLRAPHDEMA